MLVWCGRLIIAPTIELVLCGNYCYRITNQITQNAVGAISNRHLVRICHIPHKNNLLIGHLIIVYSKGRLFIYHVMMLAYAARHPFHLAQSTCWFVIVYFASLLKGKTLRQRAAGQWRAPGLSAERSTVPTEPDEGLRRWRLQEVPGSKRQAARICYHIGQRQKKGRFCSSARNQYIYAAWYNHRNLKRLLRLSPS
jgi:hypothetical protein